MYVQLSSGIYPNLLWLCEQESSGKTAQICRLVRALAACPFVEGPKFHVWAHKINQMCDHSKLHAFKCFIGILNLVLAGDIY